MSLDAVPAATEAADPTPAVPGRSRTTACGAALALFALTVLGALPAIARDQALLIGVGRFANPGLDREDRLLGTSPDLEAMQRVLASHWRFAPTDIRVLRDELATHDGILTAIGDLKKHTAPGDHVLIYYSGHGTSANDEDNLYDLPYATGAWVPYDFDPSSIETMKRSLVVGRRDLLPLLQDLDRAGRQVIVLSDSCFSGQVVRSLGRTHSSSRYLPLPRRDLGIRANAAPAPAAPSVRPEPPPYPYQHVVLLSAASDSESGADIGTSIALQQHPTIDGQFHGAFTDALLRLMTGQLRFGGEPLVPGSFNYAQAREALNGFLENQHFPQHPQLLPGIAEDPLNMGAAPFLGGEAGPKPPPAAPVAPPPPANRDAALTVTLEGAAESLRARLAALHGVTVVAQGGELTVRTERGSLELRGPADDPILRAGSDEGAIVRRIAAQAWLRQVLPHAANPLGLRVETNPSTRGNTFVECESFVFDVRLQKPGYLLLLDLDPQGSLNVLYPVRSNEHQRLEAGASRTIPSKDPKDRIQVTGPFGTDEVAALAFAQPPGLLVDLVGAAPFGHDSKRAELLARGLAQVQGAVSVQSLEVHTYAGSGKVRCGR